MNETPQALREAAAHRAFEEARATPRQTFSDKRRDVPMEPIFTCIDCVGGEPVILCDLHAATPDLLTACKAALIAILWVKIHKPDHLDQWQYCETLLTAAIRRSLHVVKDDTPEQETGGER